VLTTVAAVLAVRGSIWLSHRLDIVDRPDPRKVHREPIAYLGGLGMLVAFLVAMGVAGWFFPDLAVLRAAPMGAIVLGAVGIFLVGLWDDVRPTPAVLRLVLQAVLAAAMWASGVRLDAISFIAGGAAIGHVASLGVTIFWYVALMNSINLVDGLDGLAGGICCIGALSLVAVGMVLGYSLDGLLAVVLSVAVAGATMGYLVFNWHPARTFMGDGGSLLLGFLLATASLVGSTKTPTLLALVVPMVALALPLFETSFSFLRRLLRGQHPFKPDRRHLHHRLLDLGLNHRRVVVLLLFFTAFLGINSVALAQSGSEWVLFNALFLIGGIVLLIENLKFLERRREKS
jgi:UDP-GlcNAc:undecaprenyl-phosphate GlcNAc-1-phosphate transferase